MDAVKKACPGIVEYAGSAKSVLEGSDACLILTGWEEFKNLEEKDFRGMAVIEGRKVLDKKRAGFEGVCW